MAITVNDINHEEVKRIREFLSRNGRTLLAVSLLALTVAGVTVLYRGHTAGARAEASRLFHSAQTAEDLQKVADVYQSSPLSALALLKVAKIYYDQRDYGMAVNRYSDFKIRFPGHDLMPVAVIGEAHCLEEMSQAGQALEIYSRFISQNPEHFLIPQAFDGKARCLVSLGRYDEARTVYEDFMVSYPDSGWMKFMEERLAGVRKRLGKNNAGDGGDVSETERGTRNDNEKEG